ncbi:uncharacterized protein LOC114732729 [Neltuma alba]|uniref:uncharacterized protein LOC114732729 n=1 Tax=Neltuma alba TaxID=207710 RepID=UPI0010A581D5|nr:uncharacterized protein LOC114732729 [Prosopis alba]
MMDPAAGQPAANLAAEQPSNGSSGASTSGLRSFEERVLLEPMPPSGEGRNGHHGSSNPSGEGRERHHSSSNPSVNQPQAGEQAMPPAIPVAAREAEAGPSHVIPFPYHEEEVIGGDSVLSIKHRLLAKYGSPSAKVIKLAQIEAEDYFEIKVDVIRQMIPLDPEGDWERRGARALDNPRTKTREESLEKLHYICERLRQHDSETINHLKERMIFRKRDDDSESVT